MLTLPHARILYYIMGGIAILFAILCELDIMPPAYLHADSAEEHYRLDITCILITLLNTYTALRLPASTRAKKQLAADKRKHALIQCKSAILMAVAVYINLAVYYGTLRSSALYCLLISLIGFVFCYPKQLPDAENKEK